MSPFIAYIEIAEDSLDAIGRWPWPRHYHAVMTHILKEWGAKDVMFDMIFSEPGDSFDDGALAESIQQAGNVYLPVVLEAKSKNEAGWVKPLLQFQKHAEGIGHINIFPDADGIVRRVDPQLTFGGESYQQIAIKMANDEVEKQGDKREIPFPRDRNGNLMINWAGNWEETFRHYSYVDILKSYEAIKVGKKPLVKPSEFKNSFCLIGLTAIGAGDIKATPISSAYPAVGVHANVMNSMLTRQFIYPASRQDNALVMLGIALLSLLCLMPFRRLKSLVACVVLASVWCSVSFLLFWYKGVWLYVMHPLVMIFSLFIFSTIYAHVIGDKERVRLFNLATRDGLTGLYVVRHFRNVLKDAVEEALRYQKTFSIILTDIDHFKKVNDTYGHQAGDKILKEVAQQMELSIHARPAAEKGDLIARYGGEEFIVLLRDCTLTDAAFNVGERLRRAVEQRHIEWEGKHIPVTISLGVAAIRPDDKDSEQIIKRADEALYRAKEEGRNRTCLESAVA